MLRACRPDLERADRVFRQSLDRSPRWRRRDAEIDDLDSMRVGDDHVRGLQILVQDAALVRVRERVRDINPVPEHPLDWERRLDQQLRKRAAREVSITR